MPGDSTRLRFRPRLVRSQTVIEPRQLSAFSALAALVLGACLVLVLAGPAAAATPCGEKVLADWFDNGRVDKIYPLNCYEDAIDAIPDDLRDYADAEEVITRALQSALRGELAPGGRDPTPNGPNGNRNGENDPDDPGNPQAAPDVDTSGPASVPVPLLVLGGISFALLAAGGLGYLSRRRQGRESGSDDDFGTLG